MYRYGVGVEKDLHEALGWYLQAAHRGDQVAARAVAEITPLLEASGEADAIQANVRPAQP